MTKAKSKITLQVEVEIDMVPENYKADSTPQQMLEQDLLSVKQDPYILLESESAKWEVIGRLVDE